MCMTSFHSPFGEGSKILNLVRASNLAWLPPTVYSNCSKAICLAARTFAISLCSIVIFVKYHEVSTHTILLDFIDNCRDSVVFTFWRRHRQKRENEEAYVVRQASSELFWFDSPGQPELFSRATKIVLACSHRRSLQLLCPVGGNQARLDARTEFKILERSPKGGVEAGRAPSCIPTVREFWQ